MTQKLEQGILWLDTGVFVRADSKHLDNLMCSGIVAGFVLQTWDHLEQKPKK